MKALTKTLAKTLLPAGTLVISVFSVAAFSAAAAPTKIRPGAWEMSIDMGAALSSEMNKEMQAALKELESLPPEERAMMKQMMESMGLGLGKTITVESCVTEEEAREFKIDNDNMDNCEQTVVSESDERIELTYQCPDVSGSATITLTSKTEYTIEMQHTDPESGEVMAQTMSAKWLRETCK